LGSAQEFDEESISSGFLKNKEFGSSYSHALGFQE